MKKIVWTLAVWVLLLALVPAGTAEAKEKSGSYKLSATTKTLTAGKRCTLRLKRTGSGKSLKGTDKLKWKTGRKEIVTIKKKAGGRAVLIAKKKGRAAVTAVYKGKKYRCRVNVKAKKKKADADLSGRKDHANPKGADKPVLNAQEISLYYYSESDADVVPKDHSHTDSFRLKVSGTKKEVRKWELVGEDACFFDLTDYGLVTLKHGPAYEDGYITVKVKATLTDGKALSAIVRGYSETNLYLKKMFQNFAEENITDSMKEKEKADRVAEYIGEISDYELYNDTWEDIFVHGRGDCMASRHAMAVLCRFIGIKALGCSSFDEHGKTVVRADGKYYIYTTGFNEPRPRQYMVTETTYGFLSDHAKEIGIWMGYFGN